MQTSNRPFLKWAGNKFSLLDRIKAVLPEGARLIEPFAGASAVFLNTNYKKYWINDLNSDLITLYRLLAENPKKFIAFAEKIFTPENNTPERFYELRTMFNETTDPYEKSRIFLYLNRHGYNGLCRYNKKGKFNIPFGRYKKIYFPREEMLAFAEKIAPMKLSSSNFETIMKKAKLGDVVYCDPPYVPLSATANFTGYHASHFTMAQQAQLAELAKTLAKKGIPVIISNHDTPITRELYQGATLKKFKVQRFISCKPHKRVPAKELLAIFN